MPDPAVDLIAYPRRAKLCLRVAMAAASVAAQRLGLPGALRACSTDEITALWLGPDHWLLASDRASAADLVARCASALGELRYHAVDMSAAFNCASVSGAGTRELLAMGSGVDWPAPGHCVRTRFASIAIVAHARAASAFDLYYDRSYRHYLERWFAHALTDPLIAEAQPCRSSS